MVDLGTAIADCGLIWLTDPTKSPEENFERNKNWTDWVLKGYGEEVDREQLRVCCLWRRDLLVHYLKIFIEKKFFGEALCAYMSMWLD